MGKTLNLRVLFEDIDENWKTSNNVSSSMMETLNSLNNLSLKTEHKLITDSSYKTILGNPELFDNTPFLF